MYTIPQHLRENKKYYYYNRLVKFGNRVIKAQKPLLIFGASIGPFGNYEKAVSYYQNHMRKVDGIIVREKTTVEYLSKLGIENNVYIL